MISLMQECCNNSSFQADSCVSHPDLCPSSIFHEVPVIWFLKYATKWRPSENDSDLKSVFINTKLHEESIQSVRMKTKMPKVYSHSNLTVAHIIMLLATATKVRVNKKKTRIRTDHFGQELLRRGVCIRYSMTLCYIKWLSLYSIYYFTFIARYNWFQTIHSACNQLTIIWFAWKY